MIKLKNWVSTGKQGSDGSASYRLDFVIALAILVINDFWLKSIFQNSFTGKLSDFAGIYALFVFLKHQTFLKESIIKLIIILAFSWWKSELSQPFFNFWNSLPLFKLHRVLDYTDLFALGVLFIPERMSFRMPVFKMKRAVLLPVILFCFVATSVPAKRIFIVEQHEQRYDIDMPADSVVSFIQSLDRPKDVYYNPFSLELSQSTLADSLARYVLQYDSVNQQYVRFPYGIFSINEQGGKSTLILKKAFWLGNYRDDFDEAYGKRSARSFERSLIKKIRKQEKKYKRSNL